MLVVCCTARDKAAKNSFFLKLKIVIGGEQGETSEECILFNILAKFIAVSPASHDDVIINYVFQTKLAALTYRNYGTPLSLNYPSN